MAKGKGKFGGAVSAAQNPAFKQGNKVNKYADLASVWDAIRDPLAANGISVVQAPRADGPKVTVETLLVHSSGQWMKDELTMTAQQASPQAIGSAITYARRYALAAMVGVAPIEDDDGNAASGVNVAAGRPDEPPQSRTEAVAAKVAAANGKPDHGRQLLAEATLALGDEGKAKTWLGKVRGENKGKPITDEEFAHIRDELKTLTQQKRNVNDAAAVLGGTVN